MFLDKKNFLNNNPKKLTRVQIGLRNLKLNY